MLLSLIFLFLPSVDARGYRGRHSPSRYWQPKSFLSPELERLSKVLPSGIIKPEFFHADFYTEAGRRNISLAEYANTCFDAYIALKLSNEEIDVEEEMNAFIGHGSAPEPKYVQHQYRKNFTEIPENWGDLLPLNHLAITSRRTAIERLTANALNETKTFIKEVFDEVMASFYRILDYDDKKKVYKSTVSQIALKYKSLSTKTRMDLESKTCIHNAFRWLNESITHRYHYIEQFTNIVGLNLDRLLNNNRFLSNENIDEVRASYESRGSNIGMSAQEYVDHCAEMIAAMKLSREEEKEVDLWKKELSTTFGWAKSVYNTTDELIEELTQDKVPFYTIFSKRRDYVKSRLHQLTPDMQMLMQQVEEELMEALLKLNNRSVMGETDAIDLFTKETVRHLEDISVQRQLRQVYCSDSVYESMTENKFSDFNLTKTI